MVTRTVIAPEDAAWAPAVITAAGGALDLGTGMRQSFSRWLGRDNTAALTTGVMHATAVPLYAGDVVTSLSFLSGATALTQGSNNDGHWWFALYDTTVTLLSQTADQTTAAWTLNTVKTLALGAAQTIATSGLYYAAVMVNAGTGGSPAVPSLRSCATGSSVITAAATWPTGIKLLAGTNGTALAATAAAGPLTLAAAGTGAYVLTS